MIAAIYLTRADRLRRAALFAFCALVLGFLVLPILAIVPLSFNAGSFLSYPLSGFSLRWYREIATVPEWGRALSNSLVVGLATALLATLLGTLAALGLSRLPKRTRSLLGVFLLSPLFVPVIVTAVAVYFLYAPLHLANTFMGLVLAHMTLAAPYVVIVVQAALEGFDHNLLRAGASLGASPVRVFLRLLLPMVAPSVAAGAIFAFMTSFDETVVAIFLAGPERRTLPLQMWDSVRDQVTPAITAVATVLVIVSASLLAAAEAIRRSRERRTA